MQNADNKNSLASMLFLAGFLFILGIQRLVIDFNRSSFSFYGGDIGLKFGYEVNYKESHVFLMIFYSVVLMYLILLAYTAFKIAKGGSMPRPWLWVIFTFAAILTFSFIFFGADANNLLDGLVYLL